MLLLTLMMSKANALTTLLSATRRSSRCVSNAAHQACKIPTEAIGSVPRPAELMEAVGKFCKGEMSEAEMEAVSEKALRETIHELEKTGSQVITDGEQSKPSFVSYPLAGMTNLAPDGIVIPFEDGHTRQLPRLTSGPFKYATYAGSYVEKAKKIATRPVKQAVISASAMSLLYPSDPIPGYDRETFLEDLVNEAAKDIRSALDAGAYAVQIDFTEGRLACKLDPTKGLLSAFIDLNNEVLSQFTDDEKQRIGVHTCPGGDLDSTHSADVDYAELLPSLFELDAGSFYVQLASEKDPEYVLGIIKEHLPPSKRIFVGVIDVINPDVETADVVKDRVLKAAQFIPVEQLGTTDDCGFSPFGDDVSTARDVAFRKIRARVQGTHLAADELGL